MVSVQHFLPKTSQMSISVTTDASPLTRPGPGSSSPTDLTYQKSDGAKLRMVAIRPVLGCGKKDTKEDGGGKPSTHRWFPSYRMMTATMLCLCFASVHMMNCNMGMAMVCMVKTVDGMGECLLIQSTPQSGRRTQGLGEDLNSLITNNQAHDTGLSHCRLCHTGEGNGLEQA